MQMLEHDTALPTPADRASIQRGDRGWRVALVALLVGLSALLPRTVNLADFTTIDESYHWPGRVQRFDQALRERDWAATNQTGHPGVTTMWLGAAGRRLAALRGVPEADWQHDGVAYLAYLRLPLAVFNSLAVALGFVLLSRLLRLRLAALAALLWAVSPFLIAHSRLLHVDGLLASFMTLSLLSLLVALAGAEEAPASGGQTERRAALLASGALGGLALLTKAPSLLLLPTVALLLLASAPAAGLRGRLLWAVPRGLLWGAVAAATALALWPALWVAPLETAQRVIDEVLHNGGQPTDGGNFFLGQPVEAPGPLFYPAVLLWRSTPLGLLGLLAFALLVLPAPLRSAVAALRGRSGAGLAREQRALLGLLAFALLFGLAMASEPKQFDRYLLPIWPALQILAAAGLAALLGRLWAFGRAGRFRRPLLLLRCAAVLLVSVLMAAQLDRYQTYYLAYFNPLLGGGRVAQRIMLVGWGEGMEQVGAWLQSRPDIARGPVLSWIPPTLAPFLPESTTVLDLRESNVRQLSSYTVLYSRSVQRKEAPDVEAYVRQIPPLFTLRRYGIVYATVHQLPRPYSTPVDAIYGDGLHLRGFSSQRLGSTLVITPSWDIQASQPGGRMAFVHVLASDGRHVAQVDLPLDGGLFVDWQAGQQFDTPLRLALPPDLPAGSYQIGLGLYEPHTGARLPLKRGRGLPEALDGPNVVLLQTLRLP